MCELTVKPEAISGIIYCATCSVTGKKYVGQTIQSFKHRITQHKKDANRFNGHFQRAINKHGWDSFTWEILEEGIETIEQLNRLERYWIYTLDTFKNGYNGTNGGMNGLKSAETREKMSKAKQGSLCYKAKLTESDVYDIKKLIFKRVSFSEIAKMFGISRSTIGMIATGKVWIHILPELNLRQRDCLLFRHIAQIDKHSDKLLLIYTSALSASRYTEAHSPNIIKCCKGKGKTAGGFKWRYATDEEVKKYRHLLITEETT